ncbi:MAG: glycoside hydrolase family 28 protein [Acidobacteriaceae bacterium]
MTSRPLRWLPAVLLAVTLPAMAQQVAPRGPVFNILDYGAHRDGTGNAADAFRAAIAAAHRAGGGTVFVPAGHYVSGPIEMVSNLTLEFDAGAIVDFPAMKMPFTPGRQQGIETLTPVPLIGGHDLENVAVIGRGILRSNNADWMKLHPRSKGGSEDPGSANGPHWEDLLNRINAGLPVSPEQYRLAAAELRPSFVRFMNSKNILIDGLRFIGSPMWTVHLLYSENATVENLVIETFPGIHTDGIVVDSSRFVRIANNYIDTGDDGIVLKSGKDADGLRVNRPTEDVTITNCTVHHAHGAVTLGSETSGGIRNIVASNITAVDTENGARIKSRRGRGGVVEDVRFDNWTMEHVGEAIVVTNYYLMEGEKRSSEQPVSRTTPVFRNIAMSNMTIDGAKVMIDIAGLPEMPVQELHLSNILGSGTIGMTAEYTDGLELNDVQLNPETGPAFKVTHSTNLDLDNVSSRHPLSQQPILRLEATPGAMVRNSHAFPGTGVFLSVEPGALKNIDLQGNILGNAAQATQETPALPPQ